MIKWFGIALTFFALIGCEESKKEVLFISHSRLCTGEGEDKVDERLQQLNYEDFELLIHGGDVLCQTSKEPERLLYSNEVFGFSGEKTLWAKGNHDDSDVFRVRSLTGQRMPWMYKKIEDTHFLVLDYFMTEDQFSSEVFIPVLDTLRLMPKQNLVVITHYLYWLYDHPELENMDSLVSNVKVCEDQKWCLKPNDFMSLIYPELVGFEQDGIQVYCAAGDMGVKRKTFAHLDRNGIQFLGNGLNNKAELDSVLIFELSGALSWRFEPLSRMISNQR